MTRAQEWEEELTRRFPSIDCNGVPITAEFITILEEMGGFDEGVFLCYNRLTDNVNIVSKSFRIEPLYDDNQVSSFRFTFTPSSYLYPVRPKIQPNSYDIRKFLLNYWDELFPQDTKGKEE